MTDLHVLEPSIALALDRIEQACQIIGADLTPRVTRVSRYIETAPDTPFWWVYPGGITPEPLASQQARFPYAVNVRLIAGKYTEGYDGAAEMALWSWLPAVWIYFETHRSLRLDDNDAPIRYLDAGNVRIRQITPTSPAAGSTYISADFQIVVPFLISIQPAPGN